MSHPRGRTPPEIAEYCRANLPGWDVEAQDVYVFVSRGKLSAGLSRFGLGMWNFKAFGLTPQELEAVGDDIHRLLAIDRWIIAEALACET